MADWSRETTDAPFFVLSLEIPPTPLFQDTQGGNVIPQVPLFDVLSKYNGDKYTDILRAGYQQRKRYSLLKLPPFIIFHLSRFTKVGGVPFCSRVPSTKYIWKMSCMKYWCLLSPPHARTTFTWRRTRPSSPFQ